MSSAIWTRCAGETRLATLERTPWRVVEAQHLVSTRQLVDSDAEQEVLETLLDDAKPPDPASGRRHYLLSTPFRYPPLPWGSRFGSREERGIWYGAEEVRTALAETAYYRLLFVEGTEAALRPLATEHTVFRVGARTRRGVDLTQAPFQDFESELRSPTDYGSTQDLGRSMRTDGVEMALYRSARDAEAGVAVAVFTPAVFGRHRPRDFETWYAVTTTAAVELRKKDFFVRVTHRFPREQFLVDGRLPRPAY
ncbi:MAG: RES family NAD+ phosphorylase [Gemmatimonadota bacterium]